MSVREANRYYDVYPRIVRANEKAEITIRPLYDHSAFGEECTYEVSIFPLSGPGTQMVRSLKLSPVMGALHIHHEFDGEQEHRMVIESLSGEKRSVLAQFHVYSLAPDLFARRPFKGDVHLHSHYSDGKEAPAYVAGACRRIGLDFMAVTDHHRHSPSLEALAAYNETDIDLGIFPGEEIHLPGNPIHCVNFGGRSSVSKLVGRDEEYRAEVSHIQNRLSGFPLTVDPYQYASTVWCFQKIRDAGGLGVFCHPYWFVNNRFDVPEALLTQILEEQPFDAVEVVGGYLPHEAESNWLQVARYNEERARGRKIPVVGASDAHTCEKDGVLGAYYTVVFSPTPGLHDLIESVRNLYSVAVESPSGEESSRAHGPFRLVRYTQFLLREVFPQHDELCVEEGRLMLAHLSGDAQAVHTLRAYKGRTTALCDRLWAPAQA